MDEILRVEEASMWYICRWVCGSCVHSLLKTFQLSIGITRDTSMMKSRITGIETLN